jgi:hypothetical protein
MLSKGILDAQLLYVLDEVLIPLQKIILNLEIF